MTAQHTENAANPGGATPPPAAMSTRRTAATLVRLKWLLTLSAMKTSSWQIVAVILAGLMAVGAIGGTVVAAVVAGTNVMMGNAQWRAALPGIMIIGGTLAILFVMLVQAMIFGESSTMSMSRFAPFGIPNIALQFGLVMASLSGMVAVTAMLCLMIWAMAYRQFGIGAVIAQLIMAPGIVVLAVCFCKAVLALLELLLDTPGGKSMFYVVLMILIIVLSQIPNMMTMSNSTMDFNMSRYSALADVLGWLPLGCLFQIPFDVAVGNWWQALLRLIIAAVCVMACFAVASWCLNRQRRTLGVHGNTHAVRGIGMFANMPDSPAGAIGARVLTLLRRDVRQVMFLIMPVIFVVIFALQATEIGPWFPFMGVVVAGWFMLIGEANGLSYDGLGFSMQVIAGVDGRIDRRGRVGAYVRLLVVYFLVLSLLAYLVGRSWRDPSALPMEMTLAVSGFGWALASLGVAEVLNCTMIYPVPTLEKPFTNPQGRAVAQAFIPMLYMALTFVVMAPTIGGALWILLGAGVRYYPWIMALALVNGIGIGILGTWWSTKLLNARMLTVLQTLERNASIQQ